MIKSDIHIDLMINKMKTVMIDTYQEGSVDMIAKKNIKQIVL